MKCGRWRNNFEAWVNMWATAWNVQMIIGSSEWVILESSMVSVMGLLWSKGMMGTRAKEEEEEEEEEGGETILQSCCHSIHSSIWPTHTKFTLSLVLQSFWAFGKLLFTNVPFIHLAANSGISFPFNLLVRQQCSLMLGQAGWKFLFRRSLVPL